MIADIAFLVGFAVVTVALNSAIAMAAPPPKSIGWPFEAQDLFDGESFDIDEQTGVRS
ncbi:hypothetical protein [Nocardia sp. CNY236]|uniref:hypothetical protein n=1 Tax=Nocardia sp. CNY236 TaxID=1169152 RepID=UPI0004135ACC|nr:hypothetical protein [Nocardia sp. CNY236]